MKVLLFDIKPKSDKKCINKDLAGGMGTGTWAGNSLRARIFNYVKKKNVVLPVLTTAYLISIFKKAGWNPKLIKIGESSDFPREDADLALVPTSIVDCHHELEVVKTLKRQGIYTGVYGTFASVVPEFFSENVDFLIKGEPEAGALWMVSAKELPKKILEVEPLEELDRLPFPDWNQFEIKKYSYSPALNKKPVITAITSRGCPYSCFFYCPYPINAGRKWRVRSIDNVIGEMEYLKKDYGVKAVDFRDPLFTFDRQRTIDFAEKLIEKNLNLIWSCETRLDCLDEKLISIMHKAGLRNLNVGIESSNNDILKSSKRVPIDYSHQEEIISFCQKLGITVAAFYIIGLENDTKESIENTVEYAKKLNTLIAQFAVSTPYPGTAFFEKLKSEKRIISSNWEDYDEYTPVFKHNFLSARELLALKEKAFVSYYFRISYLLKYMPKYFFEKFLWPF